jgi:ATP-dependent Clp protease adaptor protein ClpS
MNNQILETPKSEINVEENIFTGLLCKVILYNDDWHSFEEVINQLIKAIHCTFEVARNLTFQVHVKGKSLVFEGEIKDCLRVSSILEEIALHTEIIA